MDCETYFIGGEKRLPYLRNDHENHSYHWHLHHNKRWYKHTHKGGLFPHYHLPFIQENKRYIFEAPPIPKENSDLLVAPAPPEIKK